jgi:hypothetical protein
MEGNGRENKKNGANPDYSPLIEEKLLSTSLD